MAKDEKKAWETNTTKNNQDISVKAECLRLKSRRSKKTEIKKQNTKKTTNTKTKATKKEELPPLKNDDEIVVVSLIPNVSYMDKKTHDVYKWYNSGDEEIMEFAVIKDMHRNHKSYFSNLWLTVDDTRVIKALRLGRTFENYADLMKADIPVDNLKLIGEK